MQNNKGRKRGYSDIKAVNEATATSRKPANTSLKGALQEERNSEATLINPKRNL